MNILTAESLSKAYHEEPLFSGLSVSVSRGQKIALVGTNGCGKSTLLKILCGLESPDGGTVAVRQGVTMGYLAQAPGYDGDATVRETLFRDDIEVFRVMGEYEKLVDQRNPDPAELQRLADRIEALGAWNIEHQAREILGKLGLHDFDRRIRNLSGGEQKRIALARLLITDPDMLLLDEPTNHLDLEMIEWLEQYLCRLNKSILLVSHDRYFLDTVCDTITELADGELFSVKGNYAWFLQKKQERDEARNASVHKARNRYRSELEWMRRQPKARGTKQKARIDAFYRTEEEAAGRKAAERLDITMQMDRIGKKVLELEFVCKAYGDKVLLRDFTYTFRKGERVGVLGRNGAGKSTLLKLIMGLERPDQGRIRRGETMRFGYFGQDGLPGSGDRRVIDVMRGIADYVETGTGQGKWMSASRFLTRFRFPPRRQQAMVANLSGGEKQRLHLLTVLAARPNFLVLDEPTNDLDIDTLNGLEDFLDHYEGCMLLVSHDRYFLDRLVDHVFVFDGDGQLRVVHGNYTDYRYGPGAVAAKPRAAPGEEEKPGAPEKAAAKKKNKLSYKEKIELETIERELDELEAKKVALLERMNDASQPHDVLHEAATAYEDTETRIAEKTERWLELSDKEQ